MGGVDIINEGSQFTYLRFSSKINHMVKNDTDDDFSLFSLGFMENPK